MKYFISIILSLTASVPFAQGEKNGRGSANRYVDFYHNISRADLNDHSTGATSVAGPYITSDVAKKRFRLSPNPVKDNANLIIIAERSSEADIVIFNMEGNEVKHIRTTLNSGTNKVILSLGNLPGGQYEIFGMMKDEKLGNLRFVKQ